MPKEMDQGIKKIISRIALLLTLCLASGKLMYAQFPPPAGHEGTTAISKDSSLFVDWAVSCSVSRGFLDLSDTASGMVNYGEDTYGTGVADNMVVSLGDGGNAVLGFQTPVADAPGFDFAVFENAFNNEFLELAFVEVSTDGSHFVRFPAVSLTQTTNQVGSFGTLNATEINNLAGKYEMFFGTPFDLAELKDSAAVDISDIRYVKIVDVVGSVDPVLGTMDHLGNMVNDPWPTPFESGGFDLDAVGVIHNQTNAGYEENNNPFDQKLQVFPIPSCDHVFISAPGKLSLAEIYNSRGEIIMKITLNDNTRRINISDLSPGLYFVKLFPVGLPPVVKRIVKSRL